MHQNYSSLIANNKKSNNKIRKVAKEKGLEALEVKEAFRGSEDYGYYTKATKGAIFYIGNGEDYPNLHSSRFDFRDELIEIGVKCIKDWRSYKIDRKVKRSPEQSRISILSVK